MTWPMTWSCHVCHEERPDAQISVHTNDLSAEYGLPPGHVQENIRYCNDRQACIDGAPTIHFMKPPDATTN